MPVGPFGSKQWLTFYNKQSADQRGYLVLVKAVFVNVSFESLVEDGPTPALKRLAPFPRSHDSGREFVSMLDSRPITAEPRMPKPRTQTAPAQSNIFQ
jgi:hypothetical protein